MSYDDFSTRRLMGMYAFESAGRRAFFESVIRHLRGKPVELLSFEAVRAKLRLREESYRGLQNISLAQIIGSVGRYHDFTRTFLPRRAELQERWSQIYARAIGPEGWPPIEVYKVGEVYFVRDGNHRVSVARQLGLTTIEAEVIEVSSPIALWPTITDKELAQAEAYAQFVDITRLRYTRPEGECVWLSEPSRYNDLLGHIYLQQCVEEYGDACSLSLEEAAVRWYDTVFYPVVKLTEQYHILEECCERTPADLYLWIVEHLSECALACGNLGESQELQDFLADYLRSRKLPVPRASS